MLRAIGRALVEAMLWPIGVVVVYASWLYMKFSKPSGPHGSAYAVVLPMLVLMGISEVLQIPRIMKFLAPRGDS